MNQPAWLSHAWADLGVREVEGAGVEPRILDYYRESGHAEITSDATAWCAAFVGACLTRTGHRGTGSLMARSYAAWGEALDGPRLGAVAVLSRGADPALGHVGFLVGWTAQTLVLLGGNQADAVSVAAFDRARLVALRWPGQAAAGPLAPPAVFEQALAHVLEMEGGFTDDPYDPGGPTNRGITLQVLAEHTRTPVTAATSDRLKAALKSIRPATVREIYLTRYWQPSAAPMLPAALALFHFDTAVNHGLGRAARLLQAAIEVEIDGEIGPLTLAAARSMPPQQALAAYAEARRRRYRELPHFWRFGRGWLKRVDATLAAARALAEAARNEINQEKAMTKEDAKSTGEKSGGSNAKWWGHSMTIWGALITALSAVLPALGPALGVDITPELVRSLGDQLMAAAQALGGLIGAIIAIWGRARASDRLERREVRLQL